jgi:glycosyltransferase involved in cell wall biosynthesis
LLHPQYLELAIDALNTHENLALITTRYTEFTDDHAPQLASLPVEASLYYLPTQFEFAQFLYFFEGVCYAPAIYRTDAFLQEDVHYTTFGKFNDWPLMSSIASHGSSLIFADPAMMWVRRHPSQDTWTATNTLNCQHIAEWDAHFFKVLQIETQPLANQIGFFMKMLIFSQGKYEHFITSTEKQQYPLNKLLQLQQEKIRILCRSHAFLCYVLLNLVFVIKQGLSSSPRLAFARRALFLHLTYLADQTYSLNTGWLMPEVTYLTPTRKTFHMPTLEVFLITYNRYEHLKHTLESILAEASPLQHIPITILNNRCTDGSTELINDYCQRFSNLKHVIHNRNIGGNANIARAFELASADYVWVLCDDDEYDFTHWQEAEQAMASGADAIVVANYLDPKRNAAQLIGQMTFVPSTIYKTDVLTSTVMVNMEWNISTMFPQLAPVAHLFNHNKRIEILDHWLVRMIPHEDESSYVRGLACDDKHPLMNTLFWQVGFLNALPCFNDVDLKKHIIEHLVISTDETDSFFAPNRLWGTFRHFQQLKQDPCWWVLGSLLMGLTFHPQWLFKCLLFYVGELHWLRNYFYIDTASGMIKLVWFNKTKIKVFDKRWLPS